MSLSTIKDEQNHSLIEEYQVYAQRLAKRFLQKFQLDSFMYEDLESAAFLGLVEAANRFEPDQGITFKNYSFYRIRGAIIDYLRKSNNLSPAAYRAMKAMRDLEDERTTSIGKNSSTESKEAKLAKILNLAAKGALIHQISNLPVDQIVVNDTLCQDNLLKFENQQALKKAFATLKPKQQLVLIKYYQEDLSFEQIGKVLGGLKKSWVSRLHGQAIDDLKKFIIEEKKNAI